MTLVEMARAAGARGERWHQWIMSDEVQDFIMALPETPSHAEQDEMEQAFEEGRRSAVLADSKIVWTTAPKDFDGGGSIELEVVGDYFGKPLRKIAVDPDSYDWQMGRYGSSIYGIWEKDPLAEYNRLREEDAARNRERLAREAKQQAGREWLKTATETELDNEELVYDRGIDYKDVREERKRRREEAETSSRTSAWSRAMSLIPVGATLVDDGEYFPPIKGDPYSRGSSREKHIYYDVRFSSWPKEDAEKTQLEEASGKSYKDAGPVGYFADMIAKGKIHVAAPGEVPPRAVVERLGHDQIKDIRRLEAGGKVVWGARPRFGSEVLILDDSGKLVRAKKVLEAAMEAYRAAERAYWDAIAAKSPPAASGEGSGHAWGHSRARNRRRRHRSLKSRYGRGGWRGESRRHALAARKGWLRRAR